jgi:fructan beta-fructosidase
MMSCSDDPEPTTTRPEPYRSQYHFTPLEGWLNDPNGLVYYQGEYHLFFQHNPYFPLFGEMHWGHAVSTDLVHWQPLPIAIAPDPVLGLAYSGSAVLATGATAEAVCGEPGECLVAALTHHGGDDGTEKQSLAFSLDRGRTWNLYRGNPVLPSPGRTDFRDPKVLWYEPSQRWIMVIAAGDDVLLYGSPDLVSWSQLSSFTPPGAGDGVLECPDLFELPVEGRPGESRWLLQVDRNRLFRAPGPSAQYVIGSFDGTTFTADDTEVRWVDHASDFYAAQSWSNLGDRRVWIAWMNDWAYALAEPTDGWRGAMTIPRQLSLRPQGSGVELLQRPITELEALRRDQLASIDTLAVDSVAPLSGVEGKSLELRATLRPPANGVVGIRVRVGDGEATEIGYDSATGELFLDRTSAGDSSAGDGIPVRFAAAAPLQSGAIEVIIYVDWSSVEVFADGGAVTMSARIFPADASTATEVFGDPGGVIESLRAYALASIWEAP